MVGHDVSDAGADERKLDDEGIEVGSRTQESLAEDLALKLGASGLLKLHRLDLADEVVGQCSVIILEIRSGLICLVLVLVDKV